MEKTIEIPEGYEARIEGNKVILEQKESEDEIIRKALIVFICEFAPEHLKADFVAYLERQKYEYEVFEPIESTLEYKAGFRAGAKEEREDLIPLINRLCEAILFESKHAVDLARKTLTQIKAQEEEQ